MKTRRIILIFTVSADTALRDITDLVNKGVLLKTDSGGRSTNHFISSNLL
ncbi:hypothetical protein [Sphingobacterium puteale]